MDRTLLLLQDRVYWPGMSRDVRDHIRTCNRCQRTKDKPDKEEIEQTKATYPLELVHVDLLLIGGKKGHKEGCKRGSGHRPLHPLFSSLCDQFTNGLNSCKSSICKLLY